MIQRPVSSSRNLVVVAGGQGRYDVDADDAIVGVVVGIDDDTEINPDRPALLADCVLAVFLNEGAMEVADHDRRSFRAVVPFGFFQLEEDVDVLERLGFRVAGVGPGQETACDLEPGVEKVTHLRMPCGRVPLLPLVQLEPALELAEGLVDGKHQAGLQ